MKIGRAQHDKFIVATDDTEFGFRFDGRHRPADVFKEDGNVIIVMLLLV